MILIMILVPLAKSDENNHDDSRCWKIRHQGAPVLNDNKRFN